MAHDVFISYSSKDQLTAEAVRAALEGRGIGCWIAPRDILPGSDWGEAIIDAIGSCRVMVLVFSSNSNASPQVKREVERAVSKGAILMPIRIQDVPMNKSFEYFLSTGHWLDALTAPLEPHLDNLVSAVRTHLERASRRVSSSTASSIAGEKVTHTPRVEIQRPVPPTPAVRLLIASDGKETARNRTSHQATHIAAKNPAAAGSEAATGNQREAVNPAFLIGIACRFGSHASAAALSGVDFSPDGLSIASAARDGSIRLWDTQTGGPTAGPGPAGHAVAAVCVRFAPDGRTLYSGGKGGEILLWDTTTGDNLGRWEGHSGEVAAIDVMPDGSFVLSAGADGTVRIWNAGNGEPVNVLRGHVEGVLCLAVAPDGTLAVSGGRDRTLRVWDLVAGGCRGTIRHSDVVTAVRVLPDGGRAISAGHDRTLRFWNLQSLKTVGIFFAGHKSRINCIDISPDGRLAISGGAEGSVKLWDLGTRECRNTFERSHSDEVTSVRFDPSGRHAISAGRDKTLRALVTDSGQELWHIAPSPGFDSIAAVVTPRDEGQATPGLLAVGADGTIQVWNELLAGRLAEGRIAPGPLTCAKASANGRRIIWAAAKSGGVFHRGTGAAAALGACTPFAANPPSPPFTGLAISADGSLAVTIADDSVWCWQVEDNDAGEPSLTRVALLASDGCGERCAAVTAGAAAQMVVTGGGGGVLTAWDFATGRLMARSETDLGELAAVDISDDGRLAVAIGSEGMGVWNLATYQFTSAGSSEAGLSCVALHSDGDLAITGGDDGWLRLWELGPLSTQPTCTLKVFAHRGAVLHVSAGPRIHHATYATSVGVDGVVKEWELIWEDRVNGLSVRQMASL